MEVMERNKGKVTTLIHCIFFTEYESNVVFLDMCLEKLSLKICENVNKF